ncbi:MAG: fructosamine kinase family protein [Immundisolibacteraceae bacterium]|nr:fructosamine kinase family protein [Immundisolibacteraceae bacterium]
MEWSELTGLLAKQLQRSLSFEQALVIGGGINSSFKLCCGQADFFVKLNAPNRLAMFEQEAAMLERLSNVVAGSGLVRLPASHLTGVVGSNAFIVLEWLDLVELDEKSASPLGQGLASLHQETGSSFGWHEDGYIGLSRQRNDVNDNWSRFWQDQRLGFQAKMARRNGLPAGIESRLGLVLESIPALFEGYQPSASLLHGDLWIGNCAMDTGGVPVIFDPACYYGDAESDLAMAELFGGFPSAFYQGYRQVRPQVNGYAVRRGLYQLYHLLNHFNLFGGDYANRAGDMIEELLAETGH